jgi:pimeloyl-ACP methyl ester carboxylesterase
MTMVYEHIQTTTQDGIRLNGLYVPGDKQKTACIFIHGFTTDFYSHPFYHAITQSLQAHSNAIVLGQNRGTGIQTEFLKIDGSEIYVGSFYEKLEEAHLDISAFIEMLIREGYRKFALIGHSLGTIKAVRYLFEGEYKQAISKLVLISPFDKNVFMELKAPGKWQEFVAIAKNNIDLGKGKEIVPVPEYEDFPMTFETFYSWYQPSDLNSAWDFYRKDYDFPVLQQITIPFKAILGEDDAFVNYPQFGETAQSALETIKKFAPLCETALIPNANHTFVGCENLMATEVSAFL